MSASPHGGGDHGVSARAAKQRKASVNIHMPGELKALLHLAAAREGVSVSELATRAVRGWIDEWSRKLMQEMGHGAPSGD